MKMPMPVSRLIFVLCVQHLSLPFLAAASALPVTENNQEVSYDVSIVGFIDNTMIGELPVHIIECLKNDVRVNFIPSKSFSATVPMTLETKKIIQNEDKRPGVVALFTDILQTRESSPYLELPTAPFIKIAYSMNEFERIPPDWVSILNEHFDAAAVPDDLLVETYEKSGVTIPIFVLPIALNLEPFLNHPGKKQPQKPFVFGTVHAGKNAKLLIAAFIEAFGTSSDVTLRFFAPLAEPFVEALVRQKTAEGYTNIEYQTSPSTTEKYIDFLSLVDCYVNISLGESFSAFTRRAMALGLPLIVSNNTTLKTLCAANLAHCVPATIPLLISSRYFNCAPEKCGYYAQCSRDDIVAALKYVYLNYLPELKKAHQARSWVKQYSYTNNDLRQTYSNLVKPSRIILGDKNRVTPRFLMTTSEKLYQKFQAIIDIRPTQKKRAKPANKRLKQQRTSNYHHKRNRRNPYND